MRIGHFDSLKPVCPRCKTERQTLSPLAIAQVVRQQDDIIIEGSLQCPDQRCRMHFPIIDGIPVILSNLKQYINNNFYYITVRNDLSDSSEAILGDFAGQGAGFNTMRHYLSVYSWDHYGDMAPAGEFTSLVRCLNAGMTLLNNKPQAPMLDIGCAVGRCSFELAEHNLGLVLGIDMNFSLLRVAQQILRENRVTFPLKRSGVVFERHQYELELKKRENVDFWACDALALPFAEQSFAFVDAMNVFDAVSAPRKLLVAMRDMLKPGANAVLATPYDWSHTTPMEKWVGGRFHVNPEDSTPESLVRKMLSPQNNPQAVKNLSLIGDIEEHPWELRIHDRHISNYSVHIFACERT
jgi:2-polyprenyl-3-methyl-5-hydroxy-6-metoxy-1,4-benzoquinol methylase/uncharacterized protein YbaR (Trm112 family)